MKKTKMLLIVIPLIFIIGAVVRFATPKNDPAAVESSLYISFQEADTSIDSIIIQQQKQQYTKLFADLQEQGFTLEEINAIFSDSRIRFHSSLYRKPDRTKKKKKLTYLDWHLQAEEVQKGKGFLSTHDSLLTSAEQLYAVDKEVIVAILKIETNLGTYLGSYYRVFNALHTIFLRHWDDDKRAWAREQLIAFLIISKEQGWDLFEIYGSSAGAFGIPQFIPTSYRDFAVDGNGDGIVNLFNLEDAVHSAANYLKEHGWKQESWGLIGKASNTIKDIVKAVYDVIHAYNRSDYYVEVVAKYAKAINLNSEHDTP